MSLQKPVEAAALRDSHEHSRVLLDLNEHTVPVPVPVLQVC
jgi:hypothetical protein